MSNTWDYGVLPPDFPASSGADVRWLNDFVGYPVTYIADTRRWAVETLLDRFGSADLRDAEALVQYVLHGRVEA